MPKLLTTLFHAKAHPIASKFLGFSVSHNRTARTFTVSYPGYAAHLLARLRPLGVPPCNSPSATPSQAKELQVTVGLLLYHGRCVDGRILPATCALASEQASPTLSTMARLQHLLGYVPAYPDGRKTSERRICCCVSYRKPHSSPAPRQAASPVA
jgi:hypothetical protein